MPQPRDLSTILATIRPDLQQVEAQLAALSAGAGEPLTALLARSLTGGKRLRPALVLLASRLYGPSTAQVRQLAVALDVLHAATLVHDDQIDHSDRRRGQQALHTLWPASVCVLAGDYLLAEAVALIADLGDARVMALFGRMLRALCAGEIRQLANGQAALPDRAACYRHIEGKTASLFAAAMEMVAILAHAPALEVSGLRRYGLELGLAFQIVDDILDLTADEATLGKPGAGDLRQGLVTLPLLLHLEQAPDDDPTRAVLAGDRSDERIRQALGRVRSSGAIASARSLARNHATAAQEALLVCPPGPARRSLGDLAGFVAERGQ
jgi:geranylgeranyl pyrophosphate synthase